MPHTLVGVTLDGTGQTTTVHRFRVLHETVDSVFAQLLVEYDATLVSLPSHGSSRVERLIPSDDRCAPITVAFDDFPGLSVRFGRWYTTNIPGCGCDYCDDDADQLAADLREQIETVARTGFSEQPWDGRVIGTFRALGGDPGRWARSSGDSSRTDDDPPGADLPEAPGGEWLPWPSRTA